MGLFGGFMGFAPMAALAVEILLDPPQEVGRPFAAVPFLMAALYLPAVWASLARTDQRQAILRGTLIASLVLPFTGSFLFRSVIPLLVLAPATILLWLALGGPRWRR
ncbi:MAG: hypothetical protein IH797_01165 [Chloroflexi bacterium]|nr:hypothetical protein [Chloroflexota bacterium]